MTIFNFQKDIETLLNGTQTLFDKGVKAFVEDQLDIADKVVQHLKSGLAVVITTPEFRRNGCSANGIPTECVLAVKVMEVRALNKTRTNTLTALDAAEAVIDALDGSFGMSFDTISLAADRTTGVITATVTFNASITIK